MKSESPERDPDVVSAAGAPRWDRRRVSRLILETAALVLLLATLALLWRTIPWEPGMLRWDEAEYASLGRALWLGEGYERCGRPESLRPPGLSALLAGSFALAGEASDAVAQRTARWLALGTVATVFAIARGPWGALPAIGAAVLLGSMPAFWRTTSEVMTEVPFVAVFAAALTLFDRGLAAPRLLPLAAILAGLALAFRYTAVLALPIAVALLLHAVCADRSALRATLSGRYPWLAMAAFALAVAPWLVRQALLFGDPLIGFREASGQLARFLPEVRMPIWFYPMALPGMLTWPVLLLAIAGAIEAWRRGDRLGRCATLAVLVLVGWFSCYRFKEDRQIAAVLPFLALLAALGGRVLLRTVASTRGRLALAVLGLAAIVIVAHRSVDAELHGFVALGHPSLVRAMAALRDRSAATDRVLAANDPQVCWYAARPTRGLPHAQDAATGLRVAAENAEWLVLSNYERGQPPWATELLGQVLRGGVADAVITGDRRYVTVLVPLAPRRSAGETAPAPEERPTGVPPR